MSGIEWLEVGGLVGFGRARACGRALVRACLRVWVPVCVCACVCLCVPVCVCVFCVLIFEGLEVKGLNPPKRKGAPLQPFEKEQRAWKAWEIIHG